MVNGNRPFFPGIFISVILCFLFTSCSGFVPQRSGEIRGKVSQEVDVFRDTWGVPHIFAGSAEDLLIGQGFVHAQERLFQMDSERRLASGRLSEVLGEKTIPIDIFFRSLELRKIAEEVYRNIDGESKKHVDAYVAGVNLFLKSTTHYPVEFRLLRYTPAPFTGKDVILTGLLKSIGLSQWLEEIAYYAVLSMAGIEYFEDINPFGKDLSHINIVSYPGDGGETLSIRSLATFLGIFSEYSLFPVSGGSNSWVISGMKSTDGLPYLANDPHLLLASPSLWFENHLLSPELNVYGFSFPGAPFVIIGFNQDVAWGFTNVMLDDVDLFMEKEIKKGVTYLYKGDELKYTKWVEMISVRGRESRKVEMKKSIHGPLISGIFPGVKREFSFRWTGQDATGKQMHSLNLLNRSKDAKDIREALSHFELTAQNVLFATRQGDIGYQLAGKIPIRKVDHPPVPVPGDDGNYDWQGYYPFRSNPSSLNPPEGFIATANFPPIDNKEGIYISSVYEPPARGHRIREVISGKDTLSRVDIEHLQMDISSHPAKKLVPLILHTSEANRDDDLYGKAVELLGEWDLVVAADSQAATIFEVFYELLMKRVFLDELGQDGLRVFQSTRRVPTAALDYLLFEKPDSIWFDDVRTPEKENREMIVADAFKMSLSYLAGVLGDDPETWQWGKLHRVNMKHPFGEKWYLRRFFNIRTDPVGGDGRTVFKTEFPHGLEFSAVVGPSMRMVVSPSKPGEASVILSTGQSGHFFENHYRDQVNMWLKGKYRKAIFDGKEARKTYTHHLRILPEITD